MPSRLEQYLDEVTQPVAAPHRAEWREEVRQHIEAMTAAYEEIGHSRDEAMEQALTQFGDARTVGAQVQARLARPATTIEAVKGFVYPVALCFNVVGIYSLVWAYGILQGTEDAANFSSLVNVGRAAQILAPLLAGWWMARRLKGRLSLRRILAGLLAGIPLCLLPNAMFHIVATAFQEPRLVDLLAWMPVWFVLAAGSAILTRRLTAARQAHAVR
jgi:hypothetical protein